MSNLAAIRPAHPNDLDLRRIERALAARQRYRYVRPTVTSVEDGYRVVSPCCSRNIDPEGGTIEIALLLYDGNMPVWQLFWRDHRQAVWRLHSVYLRLAELLDNLNADPDRKFWQ